MIFTILENVSEAVRQDNTPEYSDSKLDFVSNQSTLMEFLWFATRDTHRKYKMCYLVL
jgi:hypothetical protein